MSEIEHYLKKSPNLIVTKPGCVYCKWTKDLLNETHVPYKEYVSTDYPHLAEEIKNSEN